MEEVRATGGVPICKECKYYNRLSQTCNKHRRRITGEPYACTLCREDYPEFGEAQKYICGSTGRFYEPREKKPFYELNMGLGLLLIVFLICNVLCITGLFVSQAENKGSLCALYLVGQLGIISVIGLGCREGGVK